MRWYREGGKTVVLKENNDGSFVLKTFADIRNWYGNRRIKKQPMGTWWLRHCERRQYEKLVFIPGKKEVLDAYNLWRGYGVEPRAGDCQLFLDYLLNVISSGNKKWFDYLVAWCADLFQNPCDRPGTSIAMRGATGVGKSTLARILGVLVGLAHYQHLIQPRQLVGQFNAHLARALIVFCDEAFFAGDKAHEGVIKALITEPRLPIEPKNHDIIQVDNYLRLIVASNKDWLVPVEIDDRRFLVLDVADIHAKDTKYFDALDHQMKHGGYEALLHYLQTYDLTGVNLRDVPDTPAKLEQAARSMDTPTKFWFLRLQDGAQISTQSEWQKEIQTGVLFDEYSKFAHTSGDQHRHETSFGMQLHTMCPGIKKDSVMTRGCRNKIYRFPSLEQCRNEFSKAKHREFMWDVAQGAVRTAQRPIAATIQEAVVCGMFEAEEARKEASLPGAM